MKNLLIYLKQYTKESILAPFFKLLEVIFDLLVPLVVAGMINHKDAAGSSEYIWRSFFILLLMASAGLASCIIAQYFAAKASTGFATNLRSAVFGHIQKFSFSELDTLGSNTIITRLTDDINQVQNGVNMGLRLLLRSPFIVVGSMVMAFTVNAKSALVFVVAVPLLFAVVLTIMLICIPLFKKVQSALDRLTGITRENLAGVREIRAFCRENPSVDEFEQSNRELTKLNKFVGRISALLNPLTYVLINIAAVYLINSSAIEVNAGNLAQGDVVALYNYMLQIIVELIKLASLIITLTKSVACAGRVSGILKIKPGMEYPDFAYEKNAENEFENTDAVRFDNVTFSYENAKSPSLCNINLKAEKGQTIGIIGGTGSGKSTLISLIPRFYDATNGAVFVDGVNVKNYTKKQLCEKIGTVQQKAALFKGSIRENLKMGNKTAGDSDLWQALRIAQAEDVVKNKPGELDFEIEQGGRNLSGGQRQRLSIARALVKKPEILILDDSSSALDLATDAALRKAINGLNGKMTTFIVSQRISCIMQADKIAVLDNGRLLGFDTHENLMKDCKIYKEIYSSQFPENNKASKREGEL